jgi:hypothetical protein
MAWSWIGVLSVGCGPAVFVPEGGGSDDAGTSASPTASAASTDVEPDTGNAEVSGGGMLPPCEPWTIDVVLDDPSEAITDIDFRGNRLAITGMVAPSTLVLLDSNYDVDQQHDLGEGAMVWDVISDSGDSGPYTVAGTAPDPTGEAERVFFYAYVDNTGDLVHLAHYHDALVSKWEPVRLFRDTSMAGSVISGHRGDASGQSLSTIRIDFDGSVLWSFDMEITSETPFGNEFPKGGADLWPQGDLVQLTADGSRLRVVRTALIGEIVWDRTLDIDAFPIDVRVHPDGDFLVLARSDAGAHLVRLDGNANVLWERTYSEGIDSFPSVLGITTLGTAALVAGGTREGVGEFGTWIFVVDDAGEPLFSHVGDPGTPFTFHRAVYDSRFLVTATDHAWIAEVVAHPC